jgi:hypothetical protein
MSLFGPVNGADGSTWKAEFYAMMQLNMQLCVYLPFLQPRLLNRPRLSAIRERIDEAKTETDRSEGYFERQVERGTSIAEAARRATALYTDNGRLLVELARDMHYTLCEVYNNGDSAQVASGLPGLVIPPPQLDP